MLIKEALNQEWLLTGKLHCVKGAKNKKQNLEIFRSDISNALPIISFE